MDAPSVCYIHCVLPDRISIESCCHCSSIISQLETVFADDRIVTRVLGPK